MGQVTTGIRSLLGYSWIYTLTQDLFGFNRQRAAFIQEFVSPFDGVNILDIGCGTAEILGYLPRAHYWGYDINQHYIDYARRKWGNTGKFFCKDLTGEDLQKLPRFDIVLAMGVLHHLNDETVRALLDIVHMAMKPAGRFVTIDVCFKTGQNPWARLFISMDRGKNVRSCEGYSRLISQKFPHHQAYLRHKSTGLPLTYCITQSVRN